jgi:BioD-like phosphotransacetylase family protein
VALIIVASEQAGAGKTGVAAAIARHFAYQGIPVTLARVGSGADDTGAEADAAFFAAQSFAPGSPSAPTTTEVLRDPGADAMVVAEASLDVAAAVAGATLVLVSRDEPPQSMPEGAVPAAIVVTDVDGLKGVSVEGAEGGPPLIRLGEDRTLAGFSVDEVRSAINAEVLVEGDVQDTSCDHLVIAPIASDAGQPYFNRFDTKAVVVRFDKTDMHLAAMQTDVACLILTGGRRPSDYLFDAASAKGVPVLLSRTDTENTVIALEGIFDRTRFSGGRKLNRMAELLERTPLYSALAPTSPAGTETPNRPDP